MYIVVINTLFLILPMCFVNFSEMIISFYRVFIKYCVFFQEFLKVCHLFLASSRLLLVVQKITSQ